MVTTQCGKWPIKLVKLSQRLIYPIMMGQSTCTGPQSAKPNACGFFLINSSKSIIIFFQINRSFQDQVSFHCQKNRTIHQTFQLMLFKKMNDKLKSKFPLFALLVKSGNRAFSTTNSQLGLSHWWPIA